MNCRSASLAARSRRCAGACERGHRPRTPPPPPRPLPSRPGGPEDGSPTDRPSSLPRSSPRQARAESGRAVGRTTLSPALALTTGSRARGIPAGVWVWELDGRLGMAGWGRAPGDAGQGAGSGKTWKGWSPRFGGGENGACPGRDAGPMPIPGRPKGRETGSEDAETAAGVPAGEQRRGPGDGVGAGARKSRNCG